jgi:hypothetical protein
MRSGRGAVATAAALAMITGFQACGGGSNTRPSPAQERAAVRGAALAGPQPPAPKKPGDES